MKQLGYAAHPDVLSIRLVERMQEIVTQLGIIFDVSDDAPSTYETLAGRATDRLVVWAGASDRTIYGSPSMNHMFRAWHDAGHLLLGAPFTLEGEKAVALWQARQLNDDTLAEIVLAEVVGQAQFFALQGEFPSDQRQFIQEFLKQRRVV